MYLNDAITWKSVLDITADKYQYINNTFKTQKINYVTTYAKTKPFSFLTPNGILLPKLFWPTYCQKNCSSDREKLLKFEAEGWEFENFLRSLEQFIQTVKGQNNFW